MTAWEDLYDHALDPTRTDFWDNALLAASPIALLFQSRTNKKDTGKPAKSWKKSLGGIAKGTIGGFGGYYGADALGDTINDIAGYPAIHKGIFNNLGAAVGGMYLPAGIGLASYALTDQIANKTFGLDRKLANMFWDLFHGD